MMIVTLTLILINSNVNAWHENLGIDDNKAAELYKTNPNDPAIVQWKNALQSGINGIDNCLDVKAAINDSCQSLMSTIISNCSSHPNELLACNDTRIAQYPSILKQAQEHKLLQIQNLSKTYDNLKIKQETFANQTIDTCVNTTKSDKCDYLFSQLQFDCKIISSYKYCKDERYLGYLKKHNILNTTATP